MGFRHSTPLIIYLADLTYSTLSLATEAFPLNVGFVASYCKKIYGRDVDIRLFKYLDELDRELHKHPPHVLGMSNYPWNQDLGLNFFKMVRELSPNTIRVMGGPSIPQNEADRDKFIHRHPVIDFYSYLEGEQAFSNLIEKMLSGDLSRKALKSASVDGMLFLSEGGEVIHGEFLDRRKSLDEIPSPYLEGLLDPFFDGLLSPILETNRGCPFACTFCHEGSLVMNKVNYFPLDRVLAELDYVAERVPGNVSNLMFTDPNFAMYERDLEVCEHIARLQSKYGWPRSIFASTGKNKKDRIAKATGMLNGSLKMWLSVQSMDDAVLKSIKRQNIKLDTMMHLSETLKGMRVPSYSELIVCLPGETYQSHLNSIKALVNADIDFISTYNLMLLDGSELNTEASRKAFGLNTHFRVIPRDFGKLSNGAVAVEVEEIVTSTDAMSFEEYIQIRIFHLLVNIIYNSGVFQPLFKYLRSKNCSSFRILELAYSEYPNAPEAVRRVIEMFEEATCDELWQNGSECREFMKRPENYELLLCGELGANLLQTYSARTTIEMNDWADFVYDLLKLDEFKPVNNGDGMVMLQDVLTYCRCRCHDLWGLNPVSATPVATFNYDVQAWLEEQSNCPLDNFRFKTKTNLKFGLETEQSRIIEGYLERFGNSPTGIGRILTKTNLSTLLRKSYPTSNAEHLHPH